MSKLDLRALEAAHEKRLGMPAGLLAATRQQESGGSSKFLDNPAAYHYGLNAQGKRVAGHTGKVSTAFGPYGILESTGRKPGYGVKPLQNKTLEEQVRFAAEYLHGRIKQAGSLEAGIASFGEGPKYAQSVLGKLRKGSGQQPVMASATGTPDGPSRTAVASNVPTQTQMPIQLPQTQQTQVAQTAEQPNIFQQLMNPVALKPDVAALDNPWQNFQQATPQLDIAAAAADQDRFTLPALTQFLEKMGDYGLRAKQEAPTIDSQRMNTDALINSLLSGAYDA